MTSEFLFNEIKSRVEAIEDGIRIKERARFEMWMDMLSCFITFMMGLFIGYAIWGIKPF